jgi:hypothetical protein
MVLKTGHSRYRQEARPPPSNRVILDCAAGLPPFDDDEHLNAASTPRALVLRHVEEWVGDLRLTAGTAADLAGKHGGPLTIDLFSGLSANSHGNGKWR